jgi:hypothetical protein
MVFVLFWRQEAMVNPKKGSYFIMEIPLPLIPSPSPSGRREKAPSPFGRGPG